MRAFGGACPGAPIGRLDPPTSRHKAPSAETLQVSLLRSALGRPVLDAEPDGPRAPRARTRVVRGAARYRRGPGPGTQGGVECPCTTVEARPSAARRAPRWIGAALAVGGVGAVVGYGALQRSRTTSDASLPVQVCPVPSGSADGVGGSAANAWPLPFSRSPCICIPVGGSKSSYMSIDCFCRDGRCPASAQEALEVLTPNCANDRLINDITVRRSDGCGLIEIEISTGFMGESYRFDARSGQLVGVTSFFDVCEGLCGCVTSAGTPSCAQGTDCVVCTGPHTGAEGPACRPEQLCGVRLPADRAHPDRS